MLKLSLELLGICIMFLTQLKHISSLNEHIFLNLIVQLKFVRAKPFTANTIDPRGFKLLLAIISICAVVIQLYDISIQASSVD